MTRSIITPIALPPQGPRGTPGAQTGFGQITYTERTLEPEDTFAAGVRQQLVFTPTTVQDFLNAPFVGHTFWDGERMVGGASLIAMSPDELEAARRRELATHALVAAIVLLIAAGLMWLNLPG